MEKRVPRILMGKPGLCGHDRGIMLVIMALRDAGMEVIYSGRHNSPEQLVDVAVQEDVDVLGVSILSGAHMALCRRIAERLKEQDADDIVLLAGGFIPPDDIPGLKALGVREVFTEGARLDEVVAFVRRAAEERLPA
ncbi:MAG: cobalamin B12-binding domain-containing protein [Betaproteobacteria bacterium]|jgi:methylmalonyl-CoA mutase, C-terminal domain|nr:cobalamin B12-binding domain-containing protein [Betaproteobacteria bacterium]MBP8007257.1 cobalamin B12-binding domain-containing protein [Burkholderiales bacterium]